MLNTVEDVRLVLVDSKRVEFNQYKNGSLVQSYMDIKQEEQPFETTYLNKNMYLFVYI